MLTAYCDESETSHEKIPVIAVGGLLMPGKSAKAFAKDWEWFLENKNIRDKKGNRIFHTEEFESPGGRIGSIYEEMTKGQREDIQDCIISIFLNHTSVSAHMAAAVPRDDFKQVMTRERIRRFGDAQAFCAFMCIVMMADWTHRYYPNQRVSYTFESGGTYEAQMRKAYERLLETEGPKDYYKLWLGPSFEPKDKQILLQPADKIVYEAAKEVSHLLDTDPPDRHARIIPEEGDKREWWLRYPTRVLTSAEFDTKANYFLAQDVDRIVTRWEQGHSMWERGAVVYQDYSPWSQKHNWPTSRK